MNSPIRMADVLVGRWHRFANIFDMIPPGPAFDALREDIRQNGILEPVVVYQGEILDGRNRYMAARDLGISFPVRDFEGTEAEALAFVMSRNLHRRHLSEAQKVAAAARAANMPEGRPRKETPPIGGVILPETKAVLSVRESADAMGVAPRTVERAKAVLRDAPPEVFDAMAAGHISPSLAAKVADLPDEAKAEVAAAPPERMREVAREVAKPFVANNTGNNEWYTPPAIIDAAREVLGGFDLDPASSEIANATVQAPLFYTAETDGLAQDWPIGRIWCNPPYAKDLIGPFCKRLAAEFRRGSTGIVLTNNATETAWFQELAEASSAICFPLSRVKFLDPDGIPGAPLQGQAIFYAGDDQEGFAAAFSAFGVVLRHGI